MNILLSANEKFIDYAKDLKQEVTVLSADNTNKDILIKKDCFLNMSIEYAYSILRDLQIPENEIKNVYTQLISQNER